MSTAEKSLNQVVNDEVTSLVEVLRTHLDNLQQSCPPYSIHEVRRTTKKLRALLKLFADTDAKKLKKLDRTLSRLARLYGFLRDQHVTSTTALAIAESLSIAQADRHALSLHLAPDLDEPGYLKAGRLDEKHLRAKGDRFMNKVQKRLAGMSYCASGATVAVQLIPDRCQAILKAAPLQSDDVVWHGWRKEIKAMNYQLAVLFAWREVAGAPALLESFKSLGSLLGKKHDLAVLRRHMGDIVSLAALAQLMDATIDDLDAQLTEQSMDLLGCITSAPSIALINEVSATLGKAA